MSYHVRGLLLACALAWSFSAPAEEARSAFLKGDAKAGETKAAPCAACHGPNGASTMPDWPKLAAQGAPYTHEQLVAFKCPTDAAAQKAQKCTPRVNPIMQQQAAPLSDQDMQDLAAYFAAQEPAPGVASKDAIPVAEKLYRAGDATRGVAACAGCHGPAGAGNPAAKYPRIGGQHANYVATQLKAYRSGERKGGSNSLIMAAVASKLTDEEIAALASYVNGLKE
ncbi:MAG TPA: c-type cytochrome [Nevskiaceae bacterium]|nr:c-type cytochrome [Nevskiaceae bacterium]